jgi:transposase
MDQKRRRTFTEGFKRNAVDPVLAGESSLAQVARELNIDASLLHGWKTNLAKKSEVAKATETLEEENRRLRRENASLREDREILKKASAFFAKEIS